MPTLTSSFKKKRGFTIIELLVVITIIGLLTTVATVNYTAAQQRSRDNNRKTQVYSIAQAIEAYYGVKKDFPGKINTAINPVGSAANWSYNHKNCEMIDSADNSFYYFYYPTVPVTSSVNAAWIHCSDKTNAAANTYTYAGKTTTYDPNLYKPSPSWIPGLSDYLSPQPIESRYVGSDGKQTKPNFSVPPGVTTADYCNLLISPCTITTNGDTATFNPNQTQTIAYKHLVDGYAVFIRLEKNDADALPKNTSLTGSPIMPTNSSIVTNTNIFMVRK